MKKNDLTKSIPTHIKSEELVEKRRQQIVLAAIKLFSKKGFVKTTLKDLAEEAGLSYGNIYDYVGNKEDIFVLVHDFVTGEADRSISRIMNDIDDPLKKLKGMIHSEFELSARWADAILFVYQDIHILKKPLLKGLLSKESEHVGKFKKVLDACIEKGDLRNCNTQIMANLIKIMIDSWVIKRWDLRGITQFQMETAILKLFFDGLRMQKSNRKKSSAIDAELEGKTVLMINGDSIFGSAISSFLLSRGAHLATYNPCADMAGRSRRSSSSGLEEPGGITAYSRDEYGPMTQQLFSRIQRECGRFDIVVQDVGVAGSDMGKPGERRALLNKQLAENLHMARTLSGALEKSFDSSRSGRLLYVAPWAWDKYVDPILYETVKAGIIAIAKVNSERMREFGVTVNCLVPGFIGGIRNLNALSDAISPSSVETALKQAGLGEVSDIVKTAAFLISDSAKYVTGQVLTVDGGIF